MQDLDVTIPELLWPGFSSPVSLSFSLQNLGVDLPLPTSTSPNYVIKVYASSSDTMGSGTQTDISPRALENLPEAYYEAMESGAEYNLINLQVGGALIN